MERLISVVLYHHLGTIFSFFLILCLSLFPHLQNLLTNDAIAYNFIACGVHIFSAHHPNTLANFTPCKTSLGIVKIDKLPTSCRGSANEGYCRADDCVCPFAILVCPFDFVGAGALTCKMQTFDRKQTVARHWKASGEHNEGFRLAERETETSERDSFFPSSQCTHARIICIIINS